MLLQIARYFLHVDLVDADVLDACAGDADDFDDAAGLLGVVGVGDEEVAAGRGGWLAAGFDLGCYGEGVIGVLDGLVCHWACVWDALLVGI